MIGNVWAKATMFLCLIPAWAIAQGQTMHPQTSPFPRAAVSPFLNLSRGGSNALNYYNLVRPQLDTQSALQQLQQDSRTVPAGPAPVDGMLTTGHAARFMNYSHYYYSNLGAQGALNTRPTTQLPYPLPSLRR